MSEQGFVHHEKSVFLFVTHIRGQDAVVHKEFEVVRGKTNRNLE